MDLVEVPQEVFLEVHVLCPPRDKRLNKRQIKEQVHVVGTEVQLQIHSPGTQPVADFGRSAFKTLQVWV